jgi:glycosyltransferase involved in cell wall biosynthesis
MRYLFLTTGCLNGNASFVRLREFGRQLALRGVEVTYIADDTPFNYKIAKEMIHGGMRLVSAKRPLLKIIQRRWHVRKTKADVIHILNPQPANLSAALGHKECLVCDWDELPSQWIQQAVKKQLRRFCEVIAIRHSNLTVVASKHLQTYFYGQYGRLAHYIPYATYLDAVADGDSPFTAPTAVYVGNIYPAFDHDLLIDAWKILTTDNAAPDLQIIGGGPDLEKVRRDVENADLSMISLPGFTTGDALWRAMRHAHVLLFPFRDTVGNRMRCPSKTFAYMQAKRPIITCRVGEVANILGDSGRYVEPTPQAFAAEIRKIFQEPTPDIDYDLGPHTWARRTDELLQHVQAITTT